ncbi:MAG TPA: hypothetical protein VLE95_07025 [Chlamydiales bacterium]|nr:hypothetical protein [Chlamydiales bacterium]
MKIGSDTYGKEVIEVLNVLGIAKLNGTTISKSLTITGNLAANSAHIYRLQAEGNIKLDDTIVEDEAHITGALQANHSEFQGPIVFSGQKALFSKCKLSKITIQRDAAFKAKQVIELKSTIVEGPIVFEGGGGTVLLYPESKVTGSVTGGKITYKR